MASYKFALAQTLLDFRDRGSDLITLDELAAPFSKHVCLHIKNAPKQATSPSSKFLDACKSHNKGETTQSDLITTTSRIGFNNVIDAFHMALLHKSPLARIHCVNPTPFAKASSQSIAVMSHATLSGIAGRPTADC